MGPLRDLVPAVVRRADNPVKGSAHPKAHVFNHFPAEP